MNTEDQSRSFRVLWRLLMARFRRYMDAIIADINHNEVISDLAVRTDLTASYLSSIILANLIALLGLLTDSVAVVIGAMLISPLMGPIFTLGLAFAIGDLHLTRRAVRNIVFSVVITVVIAALFTMLSPLKETTHEILARTRPNVYDLLIAVFAGTAGALALCTRKNYLFTTTGVAVATAVIPPLSVVGYGVGTWHPGMAAGGFLLFFTNLVAIVISSNIVFYVLKFRGSMAVEPQYSARRRFQILGVVLAIISIPLVVTLVTDLRIVALTKRVESVLKAHLNRQQQSRITRVSIGKDNGHYVVTASVNTVKYVDSAIHDTIEQELTHQTGKPSRLELEQIIVRSGAVDTAVPLGSVISTAPPKPETLAMLQEKTMSKVREGCREVESFIVPYKIVDCRILLSDQGIPPTLMISISRDYPVDSSELRWITEVLQKKLAVPLEVKAETVPFLPPITFTDKNEPDENSRKALGQLKPVIAKWPGFRLKLEAPPVNHRSAQSVKVQVANVRGFLVRELGVPASRISEVIGRDTMIRIKVEEK